MTTITIPPEALEAADRAYGCNCPACKKAVRRVAQALLAAWPGMKHFDRDDDEGLCGLTILPLPTETEHAEA